MTPLDRLMDRAPEDVVDTAGTRNKRRYVSIADTDYQEDQAVASWDVVDRHVRAGGVAWVLEGVGLWRAPAYRVHDTDLPRLRQRHVDNHPMDGDDWALSASAWRAADHEVIYLLTVTC